MGGAMKGASDGGILIPHSDKRFPGYDMESKELDADTLRRYIFGGHVAEYMETLVDDDVEADGLEDLYAEAHKAIREDPWKKPESDAPKKSKDEWKGISKKHKDRKLTKEEKEAGIKERIQNILDEE